MKTVLERFKTRARGVTDVPVTFNEVFSCCITVTWLRRQPSCHFQRGIMVVVVVVLHHFTPLSPRGSDLHSSDPEGKHGVTTPAHRPRLTYCTSPSNTPAPLLQMCRANTSSHPLVCPSTAFLLWRILFLL